MNKPETCDCDHLCRARNPLTGRCRSCGRRYSKIFLDSEPKSESSNTPDREEESHREISRILNKRANIEQWLIARSKQGKGLTPQQCFDLAMCLGKDKESWTSEQKKLLTFED